jgi:hypothetical protein
MHCISVIRRAPLFFFSSSDSIEKDGGPWDDLLSNLFEQLSHVVLLEYRDTLLII